MENDERYFWDLTGYLLVKGVLTARGLGGGPPPPMCFSGRQPGQALDQMQKSWEIRDKQ